MSVSLMKPSLSCSFSGPLPAANACAHDNKPTTRLTKILVLTLTSSPVARESRASEDKAISVPAFFRVILRVRAPGLRALAPKLRGGVRAMREMGTFLISL